MVVYIDELTVSHDVNWSLEIRESVKSHDSP